MLGDIVAIRVGTQPKNCMTAIAINCKLICCFLTCPPYAPCKYTTNSTVLSLTVAYKYRHVMFKRRGRQSGSQVGRQSGNSDINVTHLPRQCTYVFTSI